MKLRVLLIGSIVLGIAGCGERAQEAPETEAPEMAPAADATPADMSAPRAAVDEAFLAHMHDHAVKLDDINYALADGDLEAASSPAYWLSRHDEAGGIPADWQPFVAGMRAAARDVENAVDLDAARAAAARITENCQGCHTAAGAMVP